MREIVTIQVGNYANFIGSHFWNFQVNTFTDKFLNSRNGSLLFSCYGLIKYVGLSNTHLLVLHRQWVEDSPILCFLYFNCLVPVHWILYKFGKCVGIFGLWYGIGYPGKEGLRRLECFSAKAVNSSEVPCLQVLRWVISYLLFFHTMSNPMAGRSFIIPGRFVLQARIFYGLLWFLHP